ncbi:MAG: toxin-antitoxin system YwqK family antitoxin [Ramlibacter sp.]
MNAFVRRIAHLVLVAGVIAVAGCTDKVLDFRNAEMNNGKVYSGKSDTPFSGTVTNVPDTAVLANQPAAKNTQPLIGFYAKSDGHLMDRILFNGSTCDIRVEKGVLHGETVCKYKGTEAKRYEIKFSQGRLDGTVTFYGPPPPNWPLVKETFKDGVLDGTVEVFSPKTQKLVHRQILRNGLNHGPETAWDQNTGNEVGRANYVDGLIDGPIERFAPDGKTMTYRATAVKVALDGVEEVFDATSGSPRRKSSWKAGKREGVWQEWDETGRLTVDDIYETNRVMSKKTLGAATQGGIQACQEAWIAAHRRQVGPDAAIPMAQVEEWEDWCKEGKLPPH